MRVARRQVLRLVTAGLGAVLAPTVGDTTATARTDDGSGQQRLLVAAFACARCETVMFVPQLADHLVEPEQCVGCQKDGPYQVDHSHSLFIEADAWLSSLLPG